MMKPGLNSFKTIVAAALICVSGAVFAHRFHAGITAISFNQATGNTEIVHTYMTHDIEALLTNLYQRQFDLSQPEDEAILRKYVEKQFYVLAADKTRLPVRWVGVDLKSEGIMIFQEIENTPLSKAAVVRDQVLVDFLPDQVNTVNVNEAGAIRTFIFDNKTIDHSLR